MNPNEIRPNQANNTNNTPQANAVSPSFFNENRNRRNRNLEISRNNAVLPTDLISLQARDVSPNFFNENRNLEQSPCDNPELPTELNFSLTNVQLRDLPLENLMGAGENTQKLLSNLQTELISYSRLEDVNARRRKLGMIDSMLKNLEMQKADIQSITRFSMTNDFSIVFSSEVSCNKTVTMENSRSFD